MSEPTLDEATEFGRLVWHCSEEGGGPDVGMSLGLGKGKAMWIGEITNRAYAEAGEEIRRLGSIGGWWLALVPGFVPIAKFANADHARELSDAMFATLQQHKLAMAAVSNMRCDLALLDAAIQGGETVEELLARVAKIYRWIDPLAALDTTDTTDTTDTGEGG